MEHMSRSTASLMSPFPRHDRLPAFVLPFSPPLNGAGPARPPQNRPSGQASSQGSEGQGLLGLLLGAPPRTNSASLCRSPRLASVTEGASASSSAQAPDIFSAAYDPFASFNTHSHTQAPASLAGTPPVSLTPSNVPELTSSPASVVRHVKPILVLLWGMDNTFSSGEAPSAGRGKAPDAADWTAGPGNTPLLPQQQRQQHGGFGAHDYLGVPGGAFVSSPEPNAVFDAASSWPGFGVRPSSAQEASARSFPGSSTPAEQSQHDEEATSRVITNVARTRKRRQLTTPADANHECRVCGKLFGRSYNFKAHMETHDPSRVYAHTCAARGCGKRFVRKTDLSRHHQSVHMKQRNYQCELCGNLFARRDTLRR